jgi:hypothetical protein
VEIDCPSSCPHLKAGRSYESEKRVPDPEVAARVQAFDPGFVQRYNPILDALTFAVAEERVQSPWLVDGDVIEVYKGLHTTMKTLSSGIYYETVPEGSIRQALFRRLKSVLDSLMTPSPEAQQQTLKVTEALQVLDFLRFVATANSNARPKSRQYLDWISGMAGLMEPSNEASRLILP